MRMQTAFSSPGVTGRGLLTALLLFFAVTWLRASESVSAVEFVDWSRPGLENGAAALAEGRPEAAMEALLRYYRTREQKYHFDLDEPLRNLEGIAQETHDTSTLEDVMQRRFTFEQETVAFENGIDWTHEIYDPEWSFMFHRHTHFATLVEAYRRTGDEKYMAEFAWQLREWHRQVKATHPRTLEVGLRLQRWARFFPIAVRSRHFDADLLALFLHDLHVMAESLNTRAQGYRPGNWGMMEAIGVLRAGTYFPELKQAGEWRRVTIEQLPQHFRAATSADGVYQGRSPHYHNVVLHQADEFFQLLEINGETVSPEFLRHYHRMLDFGAAYTRPDLSLAQFGDSDADPMCDRLYRWGARAGRPDLLYIATHGREGEKPRWRDQLFREGGFATLRSDWEDGIDARWAMFDFGPNGRGQLRIGSVDLAAYGRPLITMPGRYRYHTEDGSRALFISTPFQNTVSIDGRNQHPNPPRGLARHKIDGALKVLHAWHEGYSHLSGEDDFSIIHERQLVMIRDRFWIVADRVRTEKPRGFSYAQNWRFQPTTLSKLDRFENGFRTHYPEANIALIPLASDGEAVEKENGWYSPKYGVRHPAPWLAYERTADDGFLFFTLLAPFPGDDLPLGEIHAERKGDGLRAEIRWTNSDRDEIEIDFGPETGTGQNRWTGWRHGEEIGAEKFD